MPKKVLWEVEFFSSSSKRIVVTGGGGRGHCRARTKWELHSENVVHVNLHISKCILYFLSYAKHQLQDWPPTAYLAYSGLGSRGRGWFVASFARTLPGSGLLKHIWLFDIFFWSSSPTNPIPIYLICPIWVTSDPTVFWGLVKHRGDKWLWRIPGVQKICQCWWGVFKI